jgi:hypothetical protein
MIHEVINISTTTERYIANGILTHNKLTDTGCPDLTTYISQGVQTTYKKPQIFYQASYTPSLPITITLTNVTDYTYNYFTILSDGTPCLPDATPMTRTSFRSGSTSVTTLTTTSNMNYVAASYGWQAKYFVSFSVETRAGQKEPGTYYWAAALTARDNSRVNATNSYAGTGYSIVTGNITISSCLTPDTLIEKYDRKTVFLKDIQVGDAIMSIDPETKQYEQSIVTSKTYHTVNELYIINNGILRCSKSHKHVIRRDNSWIVVTSDEINLGDIVMTKDLKEIIITKIEVIN